MTTVVDGDVAEVLKVESVEGTMDLSDGGVVVPRELAEDEGWTLGQEVELSVPGLSMQTAPVPIVGIGELPEPFSQLMVSAHSVAEVGLPIDQLRVIRVGVTAETGADVAKLKADLADATADYLAVQVMDADDMSGLAGKSVNSMLAVLYALLSLAIIIAVLGIVNTLTLGVTERRQELGMLRAVGTQRGQIRRMITLESVQVAVFGALAGLALGLFVGWALISVLADQGLDAGVVIPWLTLAVVLVAAVVVGVAAAIGPAYNAARTPPLEAITD